MAHSGFKQGWKGTSGCYSCELCGRKTRNVGQTSNHLCGNCDEWTMTTNSLNDDGLHMSAEDRKAAQDYILKNKIEAAKRGGDFSKLQVEQNSDGVWIDLN